MSKLFFFFIFNYLLFTFQAIGQSSELFVGESLLDNCKLDIPLTYKKKDMKICVNTAKNYVDKEIILLRYDSEKKEVSYATYYIVLDGKFIFFETPEMHNSTSEAKQAIFLQFVPATQRFYDSTCFHDVLEKNSELKALLIHAEK